MDREKTLEFEEIAKHVERIHSIFSTERVKAYPYFEDCICYPIDQVVELRKLLKEIEFDTKDDELEEKIKQFITLRDSIKKLPSAPEPIKLWPKGKVPTLTSELELDDRKYSHAPDFEPYMYEMLIPNDVEPKGAVIVSAGGFHADACVNEGYQVCRELNRLGYQCFHLLNRTTMDRWNVKEAGVDAARAVRYVRKNATKYRIHPDQIAYAGCSNGGITGESMIQYYSGNKKVQDIFPDYRPDEYDRISADVNAFICIYGPRLQETSFSYEGVVYPPVLFAVGKADEFGINNLNQLYPELVAQGVDVEVHTFSGVPHGIAGSSLLYGKSQYPAFDLWSTLADAFMQDVYAKNKMRA